VIYPPPSENLLTLYTDRLNLEPVTTEHAKEFYELFADRNLHSFVPVEPPTLQEMQFKCSLWMSRISPARDELWLNWGARLKESRQIIGHFQAGVKENRVASIGYLVARSHQQFGYATESLERIFLFLKEMLEVLEIKAFIDTRNSASIQLAKKLGMRQLDFIKDADFFKGSSSDEIVFSKTFSEKY
jgi:ribosomal-protein-alanine N-acetyltransferase